MMIHTESIELPVGDRPMRLLVSAPRAAGRYPGLVCYSDIFQLTGPHVRMCARLAGHGFVVAAPEIYHRIEPPGTAIPFDDAGRKRGLDDAARTTIAEFDASCRAVLDFLARDPRVAPNCLGAVGFCIGGHLAFRAALQPDVRSTVCFYPTGLHDGALGKDADAGSLGRAGEIEGDLLLVFGSADPHVPEAARARVRDALEKAGTRHRVSIYDAAHAFMRDEGERYDPAATDQAFAEAIGFLGSAFAG